MCSCAGLSDGRSVVKAMVQGFNPYKHNNGSAASSSSSSSNGSGSAGAGGGGGALSVQAASKHDYLFEIVANKITGIDTDKFDYLYRDAHALALPRGFDYKRIMYRRVSDAQSTYCLLQMSNLFVICSSPCSVIIPSLRCPRLTVLCDMTAANASLAAASLITPPACTTSTTCSTSGA